MAILGIHPEICEECGFTGRSVEELERHINEAHGKAPSGSTGDPGLSR